MKHTITVTHKIELSGPEKVVLRKTGEHLAELLNTFGENTELMSIETGEIISMAEIPRILGVLDGLLNNIMWVENHPTQN